ncbi:hypothetical protein HNR42_002064 [Deinobacterium chartae]|uniref:Uncharacterized protein n=1 Tax=Deinobacterium chartae TaxID=521158 RepID=A0A841I2M2_9DEIO|nr:hypothetical protein [Deinobacterium chartae]MBB6098629.1 hypothetical protein [Deinobacterium chartae]
MDSRRFLTLEELLNPNALILTGLSSLRDAEGNVLSRRTQTITFEAREVRFREQQAWRELSDTERYGR